MIGTNNRRRREPCLCDGKCSCHDEPEKLFPFVIPFIVPICFPGLPLLLVFITTLFIHPPPAKHIEVNGQDCIVVYHHDRGGLGSNGHDVADCQVK